MQHSVIQNSCRNEVGFPQVCGKIVELAVDHAESEGVGVGSAESWPQRISIAEAARLIDDKTTNCATPSASIPAPPCDGDVGPIDASMPAAMHTPPQACFRPTTGYQEPDPDHASCCLGRIRIRSSPPRSIRAPNIAI